MRFLRPPLIRWVWQDGGQTVVDTAIVHAILMVIVLLIGCLLNVVVSDKAVEVSTGPIPSENTSQAESMPFDPPSHLRADGRGWLWDSAGPWLLVAVMAAVGATLTFVAGRRLVGQVQSVQTRRRVRGALKEEVVVAALEKLARPMLDEPAGQWPNVPEPVGASIDSGGEPGVPDQAAELTGDGRQPLPDGRNTAEVSWRPGRGP